MAERIPGGVGVSSAAEEAVWRELGRHLPALLGQNGRPGVGVAVRDLWVDAAGSRRSASDRIEQLITGCVRLGLREGVVRDHIEHTRERVLRSGPKAVERRERAAADRRQRLSTIERN